MSFPILYLFLFCYLLLDVPTKTDSSSNRSEIILASILPVAFMFVVLAIYLICKRKKKLQRPAKEVLSVSR